MIKPYPLLCVLLGLLLLSKAVLANNPAIAERPIISPKQIEVALFRDPSKILDSEAILQRYRDGEFQTQSENINLGYTSDSIWLAITITPKTSQTGDWVLQIEPTTLDYIKVFQLDLDGRAKQAPQISGDGIPVSQRSLFSRKPSFSLKVSEEPVLLLANVRTSSQVTIVPSLQPLDHFVESEGIDTLWLGAYYGFMISAMVFSLLAWSIIREKDYLTYAFYILTSLVFWLSYNGLTGQYLLPNHPVLANQLLGLTLCINVIVGIVFFCKLLRVDATQVISTRLLQLIQLVALITAFSLFLGFSATMFPLLLAGIFLSSLVLGYHSVLALLRPDKDLKIFAAAYLLYGLANNLTIAMNFGYLWANVYTLYTAQLAQFVHILAIHVGLYRQFKGFELQAQQAQFDLRLLNQKLEYDHQLAQDQQRLLQMIEHEIRTPISVISASTQSLKLMDSSSTPSHPERNIRYERIQRAVKRLELLVSLSKMGIEREVEDAQSIEIDLQETLDSVIEFFDNADARIDVDHQEPKTGSVWFTSGYLEFVLTNLIDNALKYSPPSTRVAITTEHESRNSNEGIRVKICNKTRSDLRSNIDRLFDKFTRFDEESGEAGLGMGLYLCKQIVTKNQGEIIAECIDDHLCFSLWIPRVR